MQQTPASILIIVTHQIHDFLIDLNGDGINDIKLTAIYENGDQWYQRFYCKITPLNNNMVAISQFDSCFNYLTPSVFQFLTPMAKSFSYNDSINKNSIWIDSTAYLAYYDDDANYIDCSNYSFTTNTEYVGVKILIPTDTLSQIVH